MKKHLLPHIIYIIYASFNTSRLFRRRGKMEMYKRVIAFTLFVVFTFGFLADCIAKWNSYLPRVSDALVLLYSNRPETACKIILKELKKPSRYSRKNPCDLHAAALQIFATISTRTDLIPPDLDQLVQNSYDYIHENCASDTTYLMSAEHSYGVTLSNSGRSGLAIPYFKCAEKLAVTDYERAMVMYSTANCYNVMGNLELSDHSLLKSIELLKVSEVEKVIVYGRIDYSDDLTTGFVWNTTGFILPGIPFPSKIFTTKGLLKILRTPSSTTQTSLTPWSIMKTKRQVNTPIILDYRRVLPQLAAISYINVLESRLIRLSDLILEGTMNKNEGLDEMRKIWGEMEGICFRAVGIRPFSPSYIYYIRASRIFASVDKEFARELFVKAEEKSTLARKYPDKNLSPRERQKLKRNPDMELAERSRLERLYPEVELSKLDITMCESLLLELEGKYRESAVLMKDFIERSAKVRTLDAVAYGAAGCSQELAKDYDLAIDYLGKSVDQLEKTRLTFELGSRGQFLRTSSVNSYWGLMRSYAARYSEQNQNKDFQGAVKTARMLRGRQFGELIGVEYNTKEALDISKLKLKPDELLLNIFSTDTSLVVFAISSDWYDVLLVPYEKNEFDAKIKDVKVQIASTASDESEYINELQNISKVVLEPIADKLKEYNKLIIIPDGMLNCIPFTLLAQPSQEEYRPLISDYEVTLFPSISFMIKERNSEYKSASEKLLAFADPFYGSRKVPEAYRGDAEVFYKRAVNSFNLFTPLPETRTEVENISNLFKPEQVTSVFGEEANEQKLKSLPTEEYRYLHFATHGVLGSHIPGLDEPALVLSEEAEGSENDGYLTMSEVEKMKLNSDLVVLSACDTGSGKYLNGEGVMGLSRGFLLAGSRSVIASLWPVASGPTVKFMSQFYKHLKSGKSKSESLRLTQLAFMNEGEGMSGAGGRGVTVAKGEDTTNLSHPSYWAPFVLIGE